MVAEHVFSVEEGGYKSVESLRGKFSFGEDEFEGDEDVGLQRGAGVFCLYDGSHGADETVDDLERDVFLEGEDEDHHALEIEGVVAAL